MSKPAPAELTTLSIAQAGNLMTRGEITSTALTEAFLARIEAVDHKIASYITVTADRARIAAKQADMELSQGLNRGPLHGIPIALKDIYETEGVLTTGHSHLRADYVPAVDAETVRRLKAGGAVILGKLATHEFANGAMTPDQPFPAARNPWNTDYQPGGSSSGSGAAVAAALCMGAMGSDTGGSIRNPAGFCGTAGIKPTYGLVSRCGIFPLVLQLRHGGPARLDGRGQRADARRAGGPRSQRPGLGQGAQGRLRRGDAALDQGHAHRARPHLVRGRTSRPTWPRAWTRRCACCAIRAPIVEEVVFPDIWDYHICGRVIITVEAHAIHRQEVIETPEKFGYTTRRRFQLGAFLTAEQYLSAVRFRRKLQVDTRAAMRGYDLVLAPNQWGPPEIFEEPQAIFHFLGKASLSMPFNVTGQPAMTVCCGFGSDGFPLAFQLAGRPFDEASVFAAGAAYERATPWRLRRPTL